MSGDYPRWMFHRHYEPLMVDNEEQEAALGPGWSRLIQARVEATAADYEPKKPPQREDPPPSDDEGDEKPEEQPQERKRPITDAPPRKKRK